MPRPQSPALLSLYERLDRLEELVEDMDELKVSTREEAERMIRDLDEQIEAQESESVDKS